MTASERAKALIKMTLDGMTPESDRELVFTRAFIGGNVSIRVTSDGGATTQPLTKKELDDILSTLNQAGLFIYEKNGKEIRHE